MFYRCFCICFCMDISTMSLIHLNMYCALMLYAQDRTFMPLCRSLEDNGGSCAEHLTFHFYQKLTMVANLTPSQAGRQVTRHSIVAWYECIDHSNRMDTVTRLHYSIDSRLNSLTDTDIVYSVVIHPVIHPLIRSSIHVSQFDDCDCTHAIVAIGTLVCNYAMPSDQMAWAQCKKDCKNDV